MIGYDYRGKQRKWTAMTLVDIVVMLQIAGLFRWSINSCVPMASGA
jgi:hypothetical protein